MLAILAAGGIAHVEQRSNDGVRVALSESNAELERSLGGGRANQGEAGREDIARFVNKKTARVEGRRYGGSDSEGGKERECQEASGGDHDEWPGLGRGMVGGGEDEEDEAGKSAPHPVHISLRCSLDDPHNLQQSLPSSVYTRPPAPSKNTSVDCSSVRIR